MHNVWSRRRKGDEPPIELRFVDLFMILLTTLIFISVILSVISAGIPCGQRAEAPPPPPARPPLRVLAPTVLLPRAAPEQPYRAELRAAGGVPPYRWHLVGGHLPAGMSWSPRGILTGTPEEVDGTGEDFSFAMRAMDGTGRKVVQRYTLEVRVPEKPWWRPRLGWVYVMLGYIAFNAVLYSVVFWYGAPATPEVEGMRDRLRRRRGIY